MGVFNALVSGSFLPWKRANRETDYETVLSLLENEIQDVQSRLTQIRLRERRASVTLTLQAFLLWAVYTFVCWFFGLLTLRKVHDYEHDARSKRIKMMVVWVPVLVSPLLIISTRRIVKWWYRRIGSAEEKHLIDLRRQKREKIDEIKRATKYDHLRMLLEKYDEGGPRGVATDVTTTPAKNKSGSKSNSPSSKTASQSPASAASANSTPQRPGPGGLGPVVPAPTTPEAQALQAQRMALMRQQGGAGGLVPPPRPAVPTVPLQKTWMDKLADAILGADPSAIGPEQKYALICARCHAHNGLALKEEFNEVQYICPHCGHFNSRRPSSAPVSSPFNSSVPSNSRAARPAAGRESFSGATETPSKPSRTDRGSKLKLRADESDDDEEDDEDDEDKPPVATLEDESMAKNKPVLMEEKEDAREERLKSLRARKSHAAKAADGMDVDDE